MKVHTYEKAFLSLGGVLMLACLGALLYAGTVAGVHLPGHVARVDPARVMQTPPFDRPGVRQTGPGQYEAVVIGLAFTFLPNQITIPRGSTVTFVATSRDVIHGFHIERTRVNVMLIPGQVSRVVHTFREPGEYLLICHEYCGTGHHGMSAKVIVQ
jgi:cytochrome c oxidase subunit 2